MEDSGLELVDITEDFRKSRRNSILWSSLTIAATFGHTSSTSSSNNGLVSVSAIQTGLYYSPVKIIVFLYITSLFMFIGFIRSYWRIKLINSRSFKGKSAESVSKILLDNEDSLREILKKVNSEYSNLAGAISYASMYPEASSSFSEAISQIDTANSKTLDAYNRFFGDPSQKNIDELYRNSMDLLNLSSRATRSFFDQSVNNAESFLAADRQIRNFQDFIIERISEIENIRRSMTELHASIHNADLIWHNFYDVNFTYVVFGIGTIFSFFYLTFTYYEYVGV